MTRHTFEVPIEVPEIQIEVPIVVELRSELRSELRTEASHAMWSEYVMRNMDRTQLYGTMIMARTDGRTCAVTVRGNGVFPSKLH